MGNPAIQRSNPLAKFYRAILEMAKTMTSADIEADIEENIDKEGLEILKSNEDNPRIKELEKKHGEILEEENLKNKIKINVKEEPIVNREQIESKGKSKEGRSR